MKLADFVENIDWFIVHEQEITIICQIMLEDESDYLENEMLGRAKIICNEFAFNQDDLYLQTGIDIKTNNGEVVFKEDEYGRKMITDIKGRFFVVF